MNKLQYVYTHTHNPHIDQDVTHMKWPDDYTATYAKRNTIRKDQCYPSNVTNLSPTHTSLEVAHTTLDYAHPATTTLSNYYKNN